VKPGLFQYVRADDVEKAVSLLQEFGDEAQLLAGGQSLVPAMALRMALPDVLIDISSIAEMRSITLTDDVLRIGAGCRYVDVLRSEDVARAAPMLVQAIPFIAHEAIRNRGTIGGSLAHADPASELPACMLALDAAIVLQSATGARMIAAEDFFLGTYSTALDEGEMIIAVEIPAIAVNQHHRFLEISRRSGDYAISGGAFVLEMDADIITAARLAFFAVGDCAVLAGSEALLGKPLNAETIDQVAQRVGEDITFYGDLYNGIGAKRQITKTLTRRLLAQFPGMEL
tara:strand:- start:4094 stop:4951 length:858 start_codon:yes stop_codon:yes gene_type:complete